MAPYYDFSRVARAEQTILTTKHGYHDAMADRKHPTEKVRSCDIEDCGKTAERAVSGKKIEKAGLKLSSNPDKSAHLCREHYREFKKKTKKDRVLERLDW
jgi:hypothetical protein